jgi:Lrp/AsnC family transcriptional regulator for asnA, asnC and gidA
METAITSLDNIDRSIIYELQRDGKTSSRDIAEKLNVSDGTVRFRINKLVKKDILRITASLNPFAFADGMIAMVGMELEKRTHAATMEKIAALSGVLSVCNVTGKYDLMVEVFLESREKLNTFLIDDLSTIEGITRTETFIVLDAINKRVTLPENPAVR